MYCTVPEFLMIILGVAVLFCYGHQCLWFSRTQTTDYTDVVASFYWYAQSCKRKEKPDGNAISGLKVFLTLAAFICYQCVTNHFSKRKIRAPDSIAMNGYQEYKSKASFIKVLTIKLLFVLCCSDSIYESYLMRGIRILICSWV